MMTRFTSLVTHPLVVTYFYLFLYIALSSGVILYNKWVLSDKLYGFHYPISLTMMHMGFSGVVAFILVRIFKVVERVEMTVNIYMTCVVPISAFFAVSLWFSNTAYLYISVAFIQMLKALMPVATFFMAVLCRTDKPRGDIFWNMVLISAGVVIASVGEVHFNIIGVTFQISGILAEALRLVLTQVLLQKKGLSLNPITSLYYIAPCSFFFLAIPWSSLELPRMMNAATVKFDVWIFGSNALCALALNLVVFLVIGRTGAITVRVAGVMKDWILIGLSTLLFPDSQVTVMNAVGYSVALSGVVLYNYLKARDAKAALALPTEAPAEKKPLSAKERKLERKSSDLAVFNPSNTEEKEMTALPTLLDDVVDEEAPLLLPSVSFNERSLEEPLVIRHSSLISNKNINLACFTMTPPQPLTFNILSKPRALPPSTNNVSSVGDCGVFVTMACSQAQSNEAYAVAEAAGPCVVEEIQAYDNWKAPGFFECASGVLLWGQLPTVMQGFLATELDSPLGPQRIEPGNHSTILQHAFRYRAPAHKGRWKVEAFFGGGTHPLGYVCHHADASGPELLRRAALVGVSLVNDHTDRDIVYVNRYDWGRWGCPAAGYHLMTELLKPERRPAEKMPKGTKPKPKGNKKKNQKKKPEEDYDEYKEGLVMNRFMLVDEQGFPQLAQSLREGFKLDTKNYRFKKGNAETDAFGVNLGVGGDDNELGWLAFQDGELVGYVYDGVYCDLEGKFFRVGDTKVEVPREPTPLESEHIEFEEREEDEDDEEYEEYDI